MIDWALSRLTPILLVAVMAMLTLAGVQTVRLAHVETEFANHRTADADVNSKREIQYGEDQARARAIEKNLADEADKTRKEKYEAIAALDSSVAGLLERLRRERADRPTPKVGATATATSSGPSGTGAGLYRQDGEFLVGEAASAAQTGIERDACYTQYNRARQALSTQP